MVFVMPIAMLLIPVPVGVFRFHPVAADVEFRLQSISGVMLTTVLAGDVIRPARGCRKLIC